MSYILFTDSSADLPWSYYKEHDVQFIPMQVSMGDEGIYIDDGSMDSKTFYQKMRDGVVFKTSQYSEHQFLSAFEPVLQEGLDIIYLGLTMGLSGSHESACRARDAFKEKYPDRTIFVPQTSAVSLGLGLLVHETIKQRDAGLDFDALCKWVEENMLTFHHRFTVDDLMFLFRGGRVSRAQALMGTALSIKPRLHVDTIGRLINHGKIRGRKASLLGLVEEMRQYCDVKDHDTIAICHGDCEEEANFVLEEVRKHYNVKNAIINPLAAAIGTHVGPGVVALFFIGRKRTE
ncbi:MAG: DegV family protein [Oscillospiraceae bacterium]|jgi:DegV family protein with EDD domain|nr:DegV family protein [Oscillospiraceae bacterium]